MSAAAATPISVTFGTSRTNKTWIDRRDFAWPDLAKLLTTHTVGKKDGPCILPALMRGSQRKKDDADTIAAAFLDSDTGLSLAELADAVRRHGWAGAIHSTHSHRSPTTRVRYSNWVKYQDQHPRADPAAFLIEDKQMLPHIAAGASVGPAISEKDEIGKTADYVYFTHQPCPRYRVVLRLLRPWRAADYPTQKEANAAWKDRIKALAHALGLQHDQSCTDTSRLFYLPRYPAGGPQPETLVIEGEPCDLFALPRPTGKGGNGKDPHSPLGTQPAKPVEFSDPDTGEVFDLRAWGAEYGKKFRIADALRSRKTSVLTGHVADNVKVHITCPNEQAHSNAGTDGATFVINAGQSDNAGFVVHCLHGHCVGTDRLHMVRLMLEQGWLTIDDLTDPTFLLTPDTVAAEADPEAPFTPGWHGPPDADLLTTGFIKDAKSKIVANSQANIRLAIASCGVTLTYDEFADRELIEGPDGKPPGYYNDAEEAALYLAIDQKHRFLPKHEFFKLVVSNLARRHSFHPVRQYLNHVQPQWDGIQRIGKLEHITEDGEVLPGVPSWLTTYGGADDTPYTRAVGRMLLVAAVRRIRQPGTKFDEIVTFVTPKQGQNRSTAIEILAVHPTWYTDSLPIGADDKVVIEQTGGVWIAELADLHGKRRDVNALKNFASKRGDRARLAYGHRREERLRQFTMIGTTNEDKPLRDVTGNRRFPMVRITTFDITKLRQDRDQLWAEAATIEASGESIHLAPSLYDAAAKLQEEHRLRDSWEELLGESLDGKVGKVPTEELWAAVGKEDPGKRTQDDNVRISGAMQALGWTPARRRFSDDDSNLDDDSNPAGNPRRYCYVKGTPEERDVAITLPRPTKDGPPPRH